MTLFLLLIVGFLSLTIAVALSLHSSTSSTPRRTFPLPSARLCGLEFHHVQEKESSSFERGISCSYKEKGTVNSSHVLRFAAFLKRRDGVNLYGRTIVHDEEEPNYATLKMLSLSKNINGACNEFDEGYAWDATLFLKPNDCNNEIDGNSHKRFMAMNRFAVKEGCEDQFEERWAERDSKLPSQPGFLGFSLLRRRRHLQKDGNSSFNYSTCTLWASHSAWMGWRNGMGRSSHDASRNSNRTPTSEWLNYPASPIFWDAIESTMAKDGI